MHLVGVRDQRGETAGDGVARGLAPGGEQQAEEHVELVVGETGRIDVVEARVHDDREHVVAGVGALLGDQRAPYASMSKVGASRSVAVPGAEVEPGLDGGEEIVAIVLGHAEQDADHLHGQLGRDLDEEVDRLAVGHRVEQRTARGAAARPRVGAPSAGSGPCSPAGGCGRGGGRPSC